jgi:hypothetical protein
MSTLAKIEKYEPALVNSNKMLLQKSCPSGRELTEIIEITKTLGNCPYYQKMGAAGVLAIWLTAREMDLPPMMCLNGGMYTFSGQVSLSGALINYMICKSGHRVDILKLDEKTCKLRFWRKDRPKDNNTFEYEYTIEMATKAGLVNKTNWKTNARDMLFNRAISGGGRKFCGDCLMGAYAIGELPGDDHIVDTVPEEVNIIKQDTSDVKQLYISTDQAIELSSILAKCSPEVQKNFVEYIKLKFKIELLDELPESEYEKHKNMLTMRATEYQKEKEIVIPEPIHDINEVTE